MISFIDRKKKLQKKPKHTAHVLMYQSYLLTQDVNGRLCFRKLVLGFVADLGIGEIDWELRTHNFSCTMKNIK